MNYKKHLDELAQIYQEVGAVVAETARIFCMRHNVEYTDSKRRQISRALAKAGISKFSGQKVVNKRDKSEWKENIADDTAEFSDIVTEKIKSLEQLVEVCNIDLNVWEVERYVCNVWGVTAFGSEKKKKGVKRVPEYQTNYQVKAWLKRKSLTLDEGLSKVLSILEDYTPKSLSKSPYGAHDPGKHIVVTMADFHIGADIKDLIRTPDFDIEVLLEYLQYCVDKINSYRAGKVTLNLLGDFYESISGMNHENTFKSLGKNKWGAEVIIIANEIMTDHLLSKINNLVEVNIVSGNHDRMTASNKLDNTGEGAKVLWHMLKKDFPSLPINFSNSVLVKEVDGINYILTHGDKGLSKREISKVVFDYGDPKLFNLLLEGHYHSRKTIKALTQKAKFYEEIEVVSLDEANYRKCNVASLFTGNYYSESLGFAGTAGMMISFNNGVSNRPIIHDITI